MARVFGVALLLVSAVACTSFSLPFGFTVNFPGFSGDPIPADEVGRRLKVPEGFHVQEYTGGIEGARFMRFTSTGDLLVSSPGLGQVFLVERDQNGDGRADGKRVLLDDLDKPHGVALHDGWLYVAETGGVLRVRFDASTRTVSGAPERIVDDLPAGGRHYTRTVGVGPDEKLYVSIGSSCNVCVEEDERRAAIVRYEIDGSGERIYASGLRNAVGFAWQPSTGVLWATDNNRDLLGDDYPPCELNRITEGGFYGWPFANGNRERDPEYETGYDAEIASSIPPAHDFAAHTAPLGITFYDGESFPEGYRGAGFVALHGSWNRSEKIGFEVVAIRFEADPAKPGGAALREEPFLTGFLAGDEVSGRPVDVAVGPDGALYVSDDYTGQIYRVSYGWTPSGDAPAAASGAAAPRATAKADPLASLGATERTAAARTGAELWEKNDCATCHGPDRAKGQRPLGDLTQRYSIDSLMRFLSAPRPPMPLYPFDEKQKRELSIYLLDRFG